jgi:4-amino-4-deoxy-L-arabinose transferase-like glycosyltransferase
MTFLLGGCFLYTLCARLMSRRAALLAAGLFLTQPLLWGHAFINPKDIPFMVFFLAAVTAGIQMADHYTRASLGDSIFWSGLRDRKLILHLVWAAICLGLCVSVRVLGPAAGLIVAAYLFWRAGLKSIPILILYFGIAAVVSFSTWPNLWGSPIHRFIESIRMMANFPWEGTVLFNGIEYPSDQLPRSYLPALFGLQFTEPALLLFGLGLVGVGRFFLKESPHRLLASLVAGWFFLPVLAAILFRPVMYDNFRQFLFIVPAGFILAGIGLDLLLPLVRNRAVATALVLLIYAPGLLSLVSLHPYQYVYYNGFAGGVQGAFRRYEMDYWMTSYRQAARFLNETAEPEARIAVSKHPRLLRKYAREDLLVEDREQACRADYVVINTRHSLDLRAFPDEPVVYNVGRDRALFVVVKKLIHCKAQALD